jgi:hypothetical protein
LLEVSRRLERYLQVHGRLPNLDLNFQWQHRTLRFPIASTYRCCLPKAKSAMHDSETISPHWQKDRVRQHVFRVFLFDEFFTSFSREWNLSLEFITTANVL